MKFLSDGIEISSEDVKALENDLLDIEDWILRAIAGKINKCRGRMIKEWSARLIADPEVLSIPASQNALINLVAARPDYMNREARDASQKIVHNHQIMP